MDFGAERIPVRPALGAINGHTLTFTLQYEGPDPSLGRLRAHKMHG